MNTRVLRVAGLSLAVSAALLLGACHKKTAAVVPPATPPPPAQSAAATPAPAPAPQAQPAPKVAVQNSPSVSDLFQKDVKDIYFNFDRYDIRSSDQATLQADAKFLNDHPNLNFTIAGHCDDRGSEEYNMALGASRANSVRMQLERLGIVSNRIATVSFGKEKPFCTEENEQCWQQNRRAHLSMNQ